ncbi:carbohydrate ABC transporter permease [Intrasporangium calvum]|uniref:Carbohydrate ABC transporter membrane protein 2, CUT1 family n=1 Tax=Intrasporangium calvum (strain ATCC 23552 / DSM 43043 / JCM 3097 / NBRC 12989 / NCIMB 10167 / NRRL B-3866 / 7 KIP) TaxID=710696 RepID=E6S859_INTC7|nr:carbohydrate ABC transporter permease [Intrasporangium calvum]ADU46963.1 carbohydrate ABC transporter membrane protein 2, CUT1 family [Intrasporangium calvum DSM 43043]
MQVSRPERLANYAILMAFAVFALYPLIGIVTAALQPDTQAPGGLPNFQQAWDIGRFGSYLRASALVSIFVVGVSTVLSILAGFAFGTMRFRGSEALFYVMLVGIMVPAEAIVVPLFFDLRAIGLTDTFWALALPQVAQSVAFGTFWLRAFFRSSNRSIIEAARLDGASTWRILWQVLVPLARPALVTLVVLTFMWTWNEFLIPLVMVPTNESLRTAPLGLGFFSGQYTQGFALLAAGAVIVALPVVVLYLFLQRHFIAGMLEGAVRD